MRPKDIGTLAESAVVAYLRSNGFPHAERRALAGALDKGDILTPGVVWEVKSGKAAESASDNRVAVWMNETEVERRNAKADIGVLVMKRRGYGATRVGDWWAVLPLYEVTHLGWNVDNTDAYHRAAGVRSPARLHLSTVVALLRSAGYGDTP